MSAYRSDCPRCHGGGVPIVDGCACIRGVRIGEAYVATSADCNAVERMLDTRERETIARVVAWLRREAERHRERNESWPATTTDAVVAAYADIHADMLVRGAWKEDGDG